MRNEEPTALSCSDRDRARPRVSSAAAWQDCSACERLAARLAARQAQQASGRATRCMAARVQHSTGRSAGEGELYDERTLGWWLERGTNDKQR